MTKAVTTPSDHKQAVEFWCEQYQEVVGAPYKFAGAKDGKIISTLLKTYNLPQLKAIMLKLLTSDKAFYTKAGGGRTLGVLSACANQLVQELKPDDGPKQSPVEIANDKILAGWPDSGDSGKIKRMVIYLGNALNHAVTMPEVNMYWSAFAHVDGTRLKQGTDRLLNEHEGKWWPMPAELRRWIPAEPQTRQIEDKTPMDPEGGLKASFCRAVASEYDKQGNHGPRYQKLVDEEARGERGGITWRELYREFKMKRADDERFVDQTIEGALTSRIGKPMPPVCGETKRG